MEKLVFLLSSSPELKAAWMIVGNVAWACLIALEERGFDAGGKLGPRYGQFLVFCATVEERSGANEEIIGMSEVFMMRYCPLN